MTTRPTLHHAERYYGAVGPPKKIAPPPPTHTHFSAATQPQRREVPTSKATPPLLFSPFPPHLVEPTLRKGLHTVPHSHWYGLETLAEISDSSSDWLGATRLQP